MLFIPFSFLYLKCYIYMFEIIIHYCMFPLLFFYLQNLPCTNLLFLFKFMASSSLNTAATVHVHVCMCMYKCMCVFIYYAEMVFLVIHRHGCFSPLEVYTARFGTMKASLQWQGFEKAAYRPSLLSITPDPILRVAPSATTEHELQLQTLSCTYILWISQTISPVLFPSHIVSVPVSNSGGHNLKHKLFLSAYLPNTLPIFNSQGCL